MNIRNAGAAIREAREKAGLSREKMSDGICSAQSLYRIETGAIGVSPATFHALMEHAGVPCDILPVFANRSDFDCFLALRHARLHLDAWQLDAAYAALRTIEQMHWANNKYYYQEWLLHHCRLQFRSGKADHHAVRKLIWEALLISLSDTDLSKITEMVLTFNEIELLILLAQESLYLNDCADCSAICKQLSAYLDQSKLSGSEKNLLTGALSVVEVKYLIAAGDYISAQKHAVSARRHIIYYQIDRSLLEITFLTGLCFYYNHDMDSSFDLFQTALFCAYAQKSNYTAICSDYLKKNTTFSMPEEIPVQESTVSLSFPVPVCIDAHSLSDGSCDVHAADALTFGPLIRTLRMEQKISQSTLCTGLCSKSKLSKIENGTLHPDIFLAEALLQRLGISERIFNFWGNTQTEQIQNLKFELIFDYHQPLSEQKGLTDELKKFTDHDTALVKQLYFLNCATLPAPATDKKELLEAALACTLPDFDMNHIHQYRLSWAELSVLNNLVLTYNEMLPNYLVMNYFGLLDNYYSANHFDLLFLIHTHNVMLHLVMHSLYSAARYEEAIHYFHTHPYDELIYTTPLYTFALYYLCLCYGECGQNEKAIQYGRYAFYLEKLIAGDEEAVSLKNALRDNFGIKI